MLLHRRCIEVLALRKDHLVFKGHFILLAVLLASLSLVGGDATAQGISRGLGISASGGYFTMGGSNYENIDAGPGAEATLRYTMSPELQLILGGHYSIHKVADNPEDLRFAEAYFEPRMVISQDASLSPFVGLRIGVTRQMIREEGVEFQSNGTAGAVTAGFLWQLGGMLAIELGGSAKAILADDTGGNSLGATLGIVFTPWGY